MKKFGYGWLFLLGIVLSLGVRMLVGMREATPVGALAGLIVPEFGPEDVDRVEIVRPGAAPNVVERVSGGDWRLVAPFCAEVDSAVVMKLLDRMMLARAGDTLSAADLRRLGRTPRDFGFTASNSTVTVHAGRRACSVGFGGFTPLRNEVYARIEGAGSVFTVSTNVFAAVPDNVDALRRRRVFSARPALVSAMDVRVPEMPFVKLSRVDGLWRIVQPENAPADASAVDEAISRLLALEAERFVWPAVLSSASEADLGADRVKPERLAAYGLGEQEGFAVSLWTSPTAVERIVFGRAVGTNLVYALVHGGSAVVTVDSTVEKFCRESRGRFLDARLFPFTAPAVASISVTIEDAVYVVSRSVGGTWRIESPVVAPADDSAVADLLDRVLGMSQNDRLQAGADARAAVVKVVLGGDLAATIVSNPAPATVDAKLLPSLTSLRSKQVLAVPVNAVRRLSVASAGGETVVERDSEDAVFHLVKTPATASAITVAASAAGISGVLGALAEVKASSVENLNATSEDFKRCGLSRPAFTIAVDVDAANSVRRNLLLGNAAPGGGRYATAGGADAIFIIPRETVARLTVPLTESELESTGKKRDEK